MLEILPTLPSWTEAQNYYFRRAKDSIYKDNPAASELTNGSIIFYDLFFKEKNKKSILVHESSHHLYKKVSPKDTADFLSMSGWSVEVTEDGKVYESSPKKLIRPDSAAEKDEDFANHLESYYQNPRPYKNSYPKSGYFFNQANQLTVQFIFIEKNKFVTFNDKIKCPWNVEKKMVTSGHTVKTIEYGECKSLSIKYTYPSNLNTYEIRWEK
jgi:hypothetical protein